MPAVADILAIRIFYLIYFKPFFFITCKNRDVRIAVGLKTDIL